MSTEKIFGKSLFKKSFLPQTIKQQRFALKNGAYRLKIRPVNEEKW